MGKEEINNAREVMRTLSERLVDTRRFIDNWMLTIAVALLALPSLFTDKPPALLLGEWRSLLFADVLLCLCIVCILIRSRLFESSLEQDIRGVARLQEVQIQVDSIPGDKVPAEIVDSVKKMIKETQDYREKTKKRRQGWGIWAMVFFLGGVVCMTVLALVRTHPGRDSVAKPHSGETWAVIENWRTHLAPGMNESEVRQLLGEPIRIDRQSETSAVWYYSTREGQLENVTGYIIFHPDAGSEQRLEFQHCITLLEGKSNDDLKQLMPSMTEKELRLLGEVAKGRGNREISEEAHALITSRQFFVPEWRVHVWREPLLSNEW